MHLLRLVTQTESTHCSDGRQSAWLPQIFRHIFGEPSSAVSVAQLKLINQLKHNQSYGGTSAQGLSPTLGNSPLLKHA